MNGTALANPPEAVVHVVREERERHHAARAEELEAAECALEEFPETDSDAAIPSTKEWLLGTGDPVRDRVDAVTET